MTSLFPPKQGLSAFNSCSLLLNIKSSCFLSVIVFNLKIQFSGFPGGSVVKNPLAKAGNIDLTPGLGGSPLPQCNWAHKPQLLSLCSRTWEPQLLKPLSPRDLAPQQEKPPQREARAPQLENTPACRSEDPAQPKVNKFF